MALDKLVDSAQLDSDLTSVANAIRTKGGTSASLAFPQGFVDAVDAIQTGGGGSDTTIDGILDGTVTEITTAATKIASRALWARKSLTKFTGNNITEVGDYAFYGCSMLAEFNAKNIKKISDNAFEKCIFPAVFPSLTNNLSFSLYNWKGTIADIGGTLSQITNSAFNTATNMNVLVIRKTAGVVSLGNLNVFSGTPFASGAAGGTLYVPSALISSYQSETNWSTILGYANNQILPIEGSIYETQYADGTPIPTT